MNISFIYFWIYVLFSRIFLLDIFHIFTCRSVDIVVADTCGVHLRYSCVVVLLLLFFFFHLDRQMIHGFYYFSYSRTRETFNSTNTHLEKVACAKVLLKLLWRRENTRRIDITHRTNKIFFSRLCYRSLM